MSGVSKAVKVCVRLRPFSERERALGEHEGPKCVQVAASQVVVAAASDECHREREAPERTPCSRGDPTTFSFDRAFCSVDPALDGFASQEVIMNNLGIEMTNCLFGGFHSCLIAYGATGSGKTFSVLGSNRSPDLRGLIPRSLDVIFEKIEAESARPEGSRRTFVCGITFVEIYNERIRDLLKPLGEKDQRLDVRRSPKLGIYVQGLRDVPVLDRADAHGLLELGGMARAMSATCLNSQSSRSHCIFTIEVRSIQLDPTPGSEQNVWARLSLVDLAGSERQSKNWAAAGIRGQTLGSSSINRSLAVLTTVVQRLVDSSSSNSACRNRKDDSTVSGGGTDMTKRSNGSVSFGHSKLTAVLEDALSGNSRTMVLATISPAASSLEESVSTLRFAELAKSIRTAAVRNSGSSEGLVMALHEECEQLQLRLAHSEASSVAKVVPEELSGFKMLLSQYGEDLETRSEVARDHDRRCQRALKDLGLALGESVESATPRVKSSMARLMSISHDPSLQGRLVYLIPAERHLSVGSSLGSCILLTGLGIEATMAHIESRGDVLFITPTAGRMFVNGRQLTEPRELRHGDRVMFGYSSCFCVCMSENEEGDGASRRRGLADALAEVVPEPAAPEVGRRLFVRELEARIGAHGARAFLQRFRTVAAVVDEANAITREVRPHENLLFSIEVLSDLSTYQTDEPTVGVRLNRRGTSSATSSGQKPPIRNDTHTASHYTVAVWDVSHFFARMESIRHVYETFKRDGLAVLDFTQAEQDPWRCVTPWELEVLLEDREHQGRASALAKDGAGQPLPDSSGGDEHGRLRELKALRLEIASLHQCQLEMDERRSHEQRRRQISAQFAKDPPEVAALHGQMTALHLELESIDVQLEISRSHLIPAAGAAPHLPVLSRQQVAPGHQPEHQAGKLQEIDGNEFFHQCLRARDDQMAQLVSENRRLGLALEAQLAINAARTVPNYTKLTEVGAYSEIQRLRTKLEMSRAENGMLKAAMGGALGGAGSGDGVSTGRGGPASPTVSPQKQREATPPPRVGSRRDEADSPMLPSGGSLQLQAASRFLQPGRYDLSPPRSCTIPVFRESSPWRLDQTTLTRVAAPRPISPEGQRAASVDRGRGRAKSPPRVMLRGRGGAASVPSSGVPLWTAQMQAPVPVIARSGRQLQLRPAQSQALVAPSTPGPSLPRTPCPEFREVVWPGKPQTPRQTARGLGSPHVVSRTVIPARVQLSQSRLG